MGENKALVRLGGKHMLQHIADRLTPLTGHLFIAGGDAAGYERFNLPLCADQFGIDASLVGVYSALAASREGGCLTVACDMPFADADLAGLLMELAPGHDAVIPEGPRGPEPLFAFYSRSCLTGMRRAIEEGELRLIRLLPKLDVRTVSGDELASICDPEWTFFNVNTPEALEAAEARLGEMADGPPRVRCGPPLVCFVGRKDSGKTTLIVGLVQELAARGLRVAYIKHDVHGFQMDRKGSDTWRVAQAGASQVAISSAGAVATLRRVDGEAGLDRLAAAARGNADMIVVEGFKSAAADRIELFRAGKSGSMACREEDLVAVVSDDPGAASSVPVLDIDDTHEVLDFLIERYALPANGAGKRG